MPRIDIRANVTGLNQLKDLSGVSKKVLDIGKDYLKNMRDQVKYYRDLEGNLIRVNKYLRDNQKEYRESIKAMQELKRMGISDTAIGGTKEAGFATAYEAQREQSGRMRADFLRMQNIKQGAARIGYGLALTGITAVARAGISQYAQQGAVGMQLAPRLAGYGQGAGEASTGFQRFQRDMTRSAALFGYAGVEGLKVADIYSKLSDNLPDERAIMRLARAYGMPLEKVATQFATVGRFGGFGGTSQQEMADMFAGAIEKSRMAPRSEEFMQSVGSVIDVYSQRLPQVDPRTLVGLITSVNQMGIPGLKGMGALNVVQGLQRVSDNTSEAMMAIQTEIVHRQTGLTGPQLYERTLDLKAQGLATQDGLKLNRDTLDYITSGFDKATQNIMMTQLTGLTIPQLKSMQSKQFLDRYIKGEITSSQMMSGLQEVGGVGQRNRYGVYETDFAKIQRGWNRIIQNLQTPIGYGGKALGSAMDFLGNLGEVKTTGIAGALAAGSVASGMGAAGLIGRVGLGGARLGAAGAARGGIKAGGSLLGRMAIPLAVAFAVNDIIEGIIDPELTGGERFGKIAGLGIGGIASDVHRASREAKEGLLSEQPAVVKARNLASMERYFGETSKRLLHANPEAALAGGEGGRAAGERMRVSIGTMNVYANTKEQAAEAARVLKEKLEDMERMNNPIPQGASPANASTNNSGANY